MAKKFLVNGAVKKESNERNSMKRAEISQML